MDNLPAGPNAITWHSSVAADAQGDYVVVWSEGSLNDGSSEVLGQKYNATGSKIGSAFVISQNDLDGSYPQISMTPTGDFVVAWQAVVPDSLWTIACRRFSANTEPVGPEIIVPNSSLDTGFIWPALSMNSVGQFAVSWTAQHVNAATTSDAWVQRFGSDGTMLGSAVKVNTNSTAIHTAVSIDEFGQCVACWDARYGPSSIVYAQRISADGSKAGTEFTMTQQITDAQSTPAIAADRDGSFIIAWGGGSEGAVCRRFDTNGVPLGEPFIVSDLLESTIQQSIAIDKTGGFTVVWCGGDGQGDGIEARSFLPDGTADGDPFVVNETTADYQQNPVIAADALGNFVVTWQGFIPPDTGVNTGIFARRFAVDRPPSAVRLSNAAAPPDAGANTAIGTLAAIGPNSTHTITYTLVSGTGDDDNNSFAVSGDQLLVAQTLDFRTKPTYRVRVRATDEQGRSAETTFDIVEAPQLTATAGSVPEFRPAGTFVSVLSATPTGNSCTYSLVSGVGSTDNDLFTIDGKRLLTNSPFNSATKASYSIRVRVTDATGNFGEQVFTVTVTDDTVVALGNRVLYVTGTSAADSFAFTAGTTEHELALNGVNLAVPAADVDAVVFYGGGGANTADLTGRGTGNIAGLNATYGFLAGGGVTVWAVNSGTIVAHAGGSGAVAYLIGTTGADTLAMFPTYATLAGSGYANTAGGFGAVVAYSQSGSDSATLTGSAGNDVFIGAPTYSQMAGVGFSNYAVGFKTVSAASGGGKDAAYLVDSAAVDTLTAGGTVAKLTTAAGTSVRVDGFSVVAYGFAGGKNKKAVGTITFFLDTPGDWTG